MSRSRSEDVPTGDRRSPGASITVVVPTWRRAEWLVRCLEGLRPQEPPPQAVLVVGRAVDEPARIAVSQFGDRAGLPTRWVEVSRPGHIPPVRTGLEAAETDLVAFLDDDAEPLEGWLEALLEPFSDPSVACVGGRVRTPGGEDARIHPDAGRIRWYGKHVGNVGALDVPSPRYVHGVMEGNWAWRTDVLRSLDFDPVFLADDASMYGLDLCLQAQARGYRVVYQPDAEVLHHVAPRDPGLDRSDRTPRARAYSRNYTYIGLKHLRGVRRWAFLVWWWAVGDRGSYGLATAAVDLLSRRDGIPPQVRASFRGKREGVAAWRTRTP